MVVVKKAFDNDIISLDDYLRTIRQLANKQCKSIIKTNRLIKGTSQQMAGGAQAGMMPPPVGGQPGMMQQPGQPGMMMPGQPGMQQPGMMGMQQPMPGMMPGQPMMMQPGMMGQPPMGQPGW